jgi:coenzyme F420-0:L-glutamate ligase / coenzyme F420-1:gamma-L-glutamate ligase
VITASALEGLPEVRPGDDLAAAIATAAPLDLADTDVLVVAHKVVSKAEGRTRALSEAEPSARASELAENLGKDPRHVQAVLDESREVLRATNGVLICVTHHGFVCANAGVDASNAPEEDSVVLLPRDPDASARALRSSVRQLTSRSPAVLITDSFGRAWRNGQVEVAIGCAGLEPLDDWRGRRDAGGRQLRATWIAVADQLASAADLARRKDSRQPVVVVRGADEFVTVDDGPGATALIRPEEEDLFR